MKEIIPRRKKRTRKLPDDGGRKSGRRGRKKRKRKRRKRSVSFLS